MSELKLTVKGDIEEDVVEEIEDFVRLSRLGNFGKGKELYEAALSSHKAIFPVAAEYADFLFEQGSYGRLTEFIEQVMEDIKQKKSSFTEREAQLFKIMQAVSNSHRDRNIADALEQARAVLQELHTIDPNKPSDVEVRFTMSLFQFC